MLASAMVRCPHLLSTCPENAIQNRRATYQTNQVASSIVVRHYARSTHYATRIRARRGVVIPTTKSHVSDLFVLY